MKQFFVVGDRASKSLSPLIFNHWFKKYKIKARYSFVEVKKTNFNKTIINKINNKNTSGFNVTIPFKKDIIKHLDNLTNHAKNIGAVNCVTVKKKINGTNTDWLGYLGSVKSKKINKKNKIVILGYGGASKAIFYGFCTKGYNNIMIFNRSKKIIRINGIKKFTKKYSLIDSFLSEADLIINTTPTNPLSKRQVKSVKKSCVISDIVYKPKETKFLDNFKKNKKIYGISMLIEQAVPCFRHWFGFVPVVDRSLLKKLNEKIR
tara:strand:+ start:506 stop:1291 length:786 start_codon:yes stop_codon:yes gene_type:complete